MAEIAMQKIKPQDGFQMDFLRSSADIVIGGGAAGAGKTYALLMEPLRHITNPQFRAVIFRRTYPQIKNDGGLWDTSSFYAGIGGVPNSSDLKWKFQSKATVKFQHLEHENNIFDHQGAQYPFIAFDELTHFTEKQFFYLLSRNRSVSSVKPYVRATCNPDPDSWVASFIEWWIDQDDTSPTYGLPIPERCGKLRYFIKVNDNIVWGDTKQEVIDAAPEIVETARLAETTPDNMVKSVTFIPGSIYNNRELMSKNPEYLANLLSQDENTKAQLLLGNWKIKTDDLSLFEHNKLDNLWTNFPEENNNRYITCDAARFGRDFCVIMVWHGWEVVKITVFYKSEAHEIVESIEEYRKSHNIGKSNVLVDQDGVGDGTVKMGGYQGFHGGGPSLPDPNTQIKESYDMLKTQCYFRLSKRVNDCLVKINISSQSVVIMSGGQKIYSTQVKVGGKTFDVRELIKQDLKAIKRGKTNERGQKTLNSKAEQKIFTNGRSPDFSDCLSLREWFELKSTKIRVKSLLA
jgi:hypothetical protein